MSTRSGTARIEFGDFQTPIELAIRCCRVVREQLGVADTVIEPTCGEGAFLAAAIEVLQPSNAVAYDIHAPYIRTARSRTLTSAAKCTFAQRDFFELDWGSERARHDGCVLFLGNPPWVTNSQLGTIKSTNVPRKSNSEALRGIDAMTGKSNFDISESVLQRLLAAMRPDQDSLAMLVKSATARKVLRAAWMKGMHFSHISFHRIDAKQSFGVSVEAGLLLLKPSTNRHEAMQVCHHSPDLDSAFGETAFGWADGRLVADPAAAEATRHIQGDGSTPWRSGVKHDLARVLELVEQDGILFTRGGQRVDIERDRVYPLAKGSDVANQRTACAERRLLVPQMTMQENTANFAEQLPGTHRYLRSHRDAFAARKSSIYRNRDPFAVFGIGDYSFAPWKIAICGLYKRLTFTLFGPIDGRPVVFDDTTYSLPFESEKQALRAKNLLESDIATRFFQARVFWDAKRPITAELLRSLDLELVAKQVGSPKKTS